MNPAWQMLAAAAAVAAAISLRFVPKLRSYQFTAWIIAAVVCAMIYPQRFLRIGDVDLRNKWLILFIVQAVMFGMGTQMKLADFKGLVRMPWAVFIGVAGQFTIMPLLGFALTKLFQFEPEIAAGVILIGSCSAGLASNVMAYIAKANLALSITMTSITTMLAPVMTPFWMRLLVDERVESLSYVSMMMEIIKIVIVPIAAALLHDYLGFASERGRRIVLSLALVAVGWLAFLALGGWPWLQLALSADALPWVGAVGFVLAAIPVGVIYHQLTRFLPVLPRVMPVLSMAGIVYFTTVTTAAGRNNLLEVGGALFCAAALHNVFGYVFGYGLARLCRLDMASCRTVAFEVGLQNGGMASGIAGAMGKLGTVGLAAAIFSPWMNVSGSILANYWRKRAGKTAECGSQVVIT
ncbi:MAG TPA: bile acid:sodium symporter family protein [Verrucomicrobiae bacterium]|nr:bile acid:sodium symporter family protein [Verrucomicrobiae bacterium]